jgi:hypothetical protein
VYSLTWRGATLPSFKILRRRPKTSSSVSSYVGTIWDGSSALAYSKPYLSLTFRGCTRRWRKLATIPKPVKPYLLQDLDPLKERLDLLEVF